MTNHPNRSQYDWNNPHIASQALENVQAGRYTHADVEALVKALIFVGPACEMSAIRQHGEGAHQRDEYSKAARRVLVGLAAP